MQRIVDICGLRMLGTHILLPLHRQPGFLEGSGGKIITVLSLAGGLIALASGRFALGQVAVPVGVGIGVGTGVPIVTSVVTAVI